MGYLPYDVNLKTVIWIIVMIYIGIISSFLILRSRKLDAKSLKEMHFAYTTFVYMLIIARIFFIFSDYERDTYGDTPLHFQFVIIAWTCIIIGLLALIYILESHVITKTKHTISYILIISICVNIIMVFFPNLVPIVRFMNYALLYGEGIILISIYFYLIINTTGKLRIKSILIFIAIILISIGAILDSDALIISGISSPFYNPVFTVISITLFGYALMHEK